MAEKHSRNPQANENAAKTTPASDFARSLGSIMSSASYLFPGVEGLSVKFSVALVGRMEKREFACLLKEFPVVASIELSEALGRKSAILLDIRTASALANFASSGIPTEKLTLSKSDIVYLYDALNPIISAFSNACDEAAGRSFGSIADIEVSDAVSQERLTGELPDSLFRTTVAVRIGKEVSGRMAIILPLNLAEILVGTQGALAHPNARMNRNSGMKEKTGGNANSGSTNAREQSMENIDLILDIQLQLTARLGQVEIPIGEITKLAPGSVIDIDRFVDEPVELVVNDRAIARGEIVVVQENFGIKITEIISPKERIKSLG